MSKEKGLLKGGKKRGGGKNEGMRSEEGLRT